MRADIHDGSEHNMLQSEAGYIDARPSARLTKPSCNARPDHTSGSWAAQKGGVRVQSKIPSFCDLSHFTIHVIEQKSAPVRKSHEVNDRIVVTSGACCLCNSYHAPGGVRGDQLLSPLWNCLCTVQYRTDCTKPVGVRERAPHPSFVVL
jgi:hypothetical protein